jgi:uncharacterized protein (TIGR02996 family)
MPPIPDAFLAEILEHPDDDGPRLICADWLDEQGDHDRATFIRLQIQAAPLDWWDADRAALEEKAKALQMRHARAWLAGIPGWARPTATFERGFISKVACPVGVFLKGAAELYRQAPINTVALLEVCAEQGSQIAAAPIFARVSTLDLTLASKWPINPRIGIGPRIELLNSPHLARLRGFTLRSYGIGAEMALALAQSPILTRLTRLSLPRAGIGPDGARGLAGSPILRTLTALDLGHNSIGDKGARELFALPHLGRIRELELAGNQLGPAGVQALAASPALTELRWLDLTWNNYGPEGVQALAASPYLGQLTWLQLSGHIGTAGAVALAQSPHLTNLRELLLSGSTLGPDAAQALAASPTLARLTRLALDYHPIGDAGARALAESPHLRSLKRLSVYQCGVSPAVLGVLRERFGAGLTAGPET